MYLKKNKKMYLENGSWYKLYLGVLGKDYLTIYRKK